MGQHVPGGRGDTVPTGAQPSPLLLDRGLCVAVSLPPWEHAARGGKWREIPAMHRPPPRRANLHQQMQEHAVETYPCMHKHAMQTYTTNAQARVQNYPCTHELTVQSYPSTHEHAMQTYPCMHERTMQTYTTNA